MPLQAGSQVIALNGELLQAGAGAGRAHLCAEGTSPMGRSRRIPNARVLVNPAPGCSKQGSTGGMWALPACGVVGLDHHCS